MKYKRNSETQKKVYNSYLLATISGLGLCVSSMSNFQDTKMAVIACFMNRWIESGSSGKCTDGDAEGRVEGNVVMTCRRSKTGLRKGRRRR